jgi:hypothetical protein
MPQQGNDDSGWSVDSFDEEARAMKERFAELTKDNRLTAAEATYQIRREDNEQVVKGRMADQGQKQDAPAQAQRQAPPRRTLSFAEDRTQRHPRQAAQSHGDMASENRAASERFSRNSEALRQQKSEKGQTRDEAPARALTFAEDREPQSRSYGDLKREQSEDASSKQQVEGRALSFAEDRGQGHSGR